MEAAAIQNQIFNMIIRVLEILMTTDETLAIYD